MKPRNDAQTRTAFFLDVSIFGFEVLSPVDAANMPRRCGRHMASLKGKTINRLEVARAAQFLILHYEFYARKRAAALGSNPRRGAGPPLSRV